MDSEKIKQTIKTATDKAKAVNRHPPKWLYWVIGIGLLLLVQFIRFIPRNY